MGETVNIDSGMTEDESKLTLNRRWDRGDLPSAVPLVLVNSLGTDLTMWDEALPLLTRNRDVLRYDARGHGLSPDGDSDYGVGDLADDLLNLLDDEGVPRAHFAGISIGGMTILDFAARFPERVASIAPVSCAAKLPADEWISRARVVRSMGINAIADRVMTRWLGPRAADRELNDRYSAMLLSTRPAEYARACEAIAKLDLHPALGLILAPTLVIGGDADIATPVACQVEIVEAIEGASLSVVPGGTHIIVAHGAAIVADELNRHMSAVDEAEGIDVTMSAAGRIREGSNQEKL